MNVEEVCMCFAEAQSFKSSDEDMHASACERVSSAIRRFECHFPKPERNQHNPDLRVDILAGALNQKRDGAAISYSNN